MNNLRSTNRFLRPFLQRHLAVTPSVTSRRHFPICAVDTSLSRDELPPNFSSDLVSLVAKTLNKAEELVSVVVRSDVTVIRGTSTQPSANFQIWSVGVFDKERNPRYSQELIRFLSSSLNVPEDRVTVLFHPIERTDAGHLIYQDLKQQQ